MKESRESIATRIRKNAMLEAMKNTLGNVSQSTRLVGISRFTHYNWLKIDSEYRYSIFLIKEESLDIGESKLLELIGELNTTATVFYLKCKAKHLGYVINSKNKPISISKNSFDNLSNKELWEIIDVLKLHKRTFKKRY